MLDIIFIYFFSFVFLIIGAIIYTGLHLGDLDHFVLEPAIILTIVFYLACSFYLFFKNRREEKYLSFYEFFPLISLGISISIFFNMIFLYFIPSSYHYSVSIWWLLISSGIVGPIFEEILFRYVFYNRLKNKYSVSKSILICCVVFSLIHLNIQKIIFSFILGLIFTITYEKKKNILAPIFIHIGANCAALFLSSFHWCVLLLSFINFIINYYIIFYQTKTSQP